MFRQINIYPTGKMLVDKFIKAYWIQYFNITSASFLTVQCLKQWVKIKKVVI